MLNQDRQRRQQEVDKFHQELAKVTCPVCADRKIGQKVGGWTAGELSAIVKVDPSYSLDGTYVKSELPRNGGLSHEELVIPFRCSTYGYTMIFSAVQIGAEPR